MRPQINNRVNPEMDNYKIGDKKIVFQLCGRPNDRQAEYAAVQRLFCDSAFVTEAYLLHVTIRPERWRWQFLDVSPFVWFVRRTCQERDINGKRLKSPRCMDNAVVTIDDSVLNPFGLSPWVGRE